MLCPISLVEVGPVVLEMKIFEFVSMFSLFRNYPPLEKLGLDPSFNKLKLNFPLPKNALCQVWLKLAQWFFKFCQRVFVIS